MRRDSCVMGVARLGLVDPLRRKLSPVACEMVLARGLEHGDSGQALHSPACGCLGFLTVWQLSSKQEKSKTVSERPSLGLSCHLCHVLLGKAIGQSPAQAGQKAVKK